MVVIGQRIVVRGMEDGFERPEVGCERPVVGCEKP